MSGASQILIEGQQLAEVFARCDFFASRHLVGDPLPLTISSRPIGICLCGAVGSFAHDEKELRRFDANWLVKSGPTALLRNPPYEVQAASRNFGLLPLLTAAPPSMLGVADLRGRLMEAVRLAEFSGSDNASLTFCIMNIAIYT